MLVELVFHVLEGRTSSRISLKGRPDQIGHVGKQGAWNDRSAKHDHGAGLQSIDAYSDFTQFDPRDYRFT